MNTENVMKQIEAKVWAEIEKTAERIGLLLERMVVEVLEENDKVVTASLKKSITSEVIRETDSIIVKVFSGTNYAKYVHDGTKPRKKRSEWPPIFDLARWVQKKGIGQSFNAKGRMIGTRKRAFTKQVGGTTISAKFSREVMSVAYAVQRSIAKKGTKKLPFFRLALKRSEPELRQLIQQAGLRIASAI